MTAKIRTVAPGKGSINEAASLLDLAKAVEESGCSLLTIHGRTADARYTKAANWELICDVASQLRIPVIGNGDILTQYEAATKLHLNGDVLHGIMVGRAALIKPWLFREFNEGKEWLPTTKQRVQIYLRLVELMREHFGDDDRGKKSAFYFLPWHFGFFNRYRHLPATRFRDISNVHPLMQTRLPSHDEYKSSDDVDVDCMVERVLRCPDERAHVMIAETLWSYLENNADKVDVEEVLEMLEKLGKKNIETWEVNNNDSHESNHVRVEERG